MTTHPMPERTARTVKVKAHTNKVTEIKVFGNRDPRGPDNNVYIWIDDNDELHIRVLKPDRCYRHIQGINEDGYIEIVQV